MIQNLPDWILPNMKPSFNDLESATAIEMVYKLYGKNQELITDYKKFVEDIKNEIKAFKTSTNQDMECFKKKIIKICNDYIRTMDMKIKCQDRKINDAIKKQDDKLNEAVKYMKDNIGATVLAVITEMKENGELDEAILTAFENIDKKVENLYFDNVEAMKNATLQAGDSVQTLGYYNVNDGGQGLYKIREKQESDVEDGGAIHILLNGLVAELINDKEVNIKQFGAYCNSVNDDMNYINNAIKYLSKNGGGTLKGCKGKTSYITESIYIVSNIKYDFERFTLKGNGTNILMLIGYYDEATNSLIETFSEDEGYTDSQVPNHGINDVIIRGAIFEECDIAIKVHRLNYKSIIENCTFKKTCKTYSLYACHSWGLKFVNNMVCRLAYFNEFVDWTVIEKNTFEGTRGEFNDLLYLGNGSYSCKITSNGFHFGDKAITLKGTLRDTEISNNHFESNNYSIFNDQVGATIQNIYIHNNWFWANSNSLYAIYMTSLAGSRIEFNTYYEENYEFQNSCVYLHGTNVYGNEITSMSTNSKFEKPEKLDINNGCSVKYLISRDDNAIPQIEHFTGNFTSEKYVSKHPYVNNRINLCTKSYSSDGRILYVDTFIDYDEILGSKEIFFYNLILKKDSDKIYHFSGYVSGRTVTELCHECLQGTENTVTISVENNEGKVRLKFNGDYFTVPSGIVKMI